MAKFVFNFAKILSIKEKMEKQKQMELAKAMGRLEQAQQRLDQYQTEYKDSLLAMNKILNGMINQAQIKSLNYKISYYKEQIKNQKTEIKGLQRQVELARQAVTKALQERKTYELLKQKAYEEYLEQEKVAEIKAIDEINSYNYGE